MNEAETAFLAMVALGVFGVDSEGRIWRLRRMVGGGRSPMRLVDIEGRRAETSSSGRRRDNSTSYLRVMLTTPDGARHKVNAHRVVWMVANRATIPVGMQINHIDGDGLNNAPSNLELVTQSENTQHAIRTLGKVHPKANAAKLTPADVVEIRRTCDERLMSQRALAEKYGVSKNTIQNIARRQTWRSVPESAGS